MVIKKRVLRKIVSVFASALLLVNSFTPYLLIAPAFNQIKAQTETVAPTQEPVATPTETVTPTLTVEVTPTIEVTPIATMTPTEIPTLAPTEAPSVPSPPINPTAEPLITQKTDETVTSTVVDSYACRTDSLNGCLVTNKADYAPTEVAVITGHGFLPNTEYTLRITSSDQPPIDSSYQITTNATGSFIYSYQLDGNYRPNYKVEIKDSSGTMVTTTTFTDSVGVTVTTGGSTVSADNTGGGYATLTGPVIIESTVGEIGVGSIILNVPSGFQFRTSSSVTATRTNSGNCNGTGNHSVLLGNSPGSNTQTATLTASTITINVFQSSAGNTNNCKGTITWSGIAVRPTDGTPLAAGNITKSGTSSINGVTESTNFGTLTEVAGAKNKLAFATQPSTTATTNTDFVTKPVIILQDQFGNTVITDNVSTITRTVVLSTQTCGGTAGSGTLSSTPASGVPVVSGVLTYTAMQYSAGESIKICASSSGVTSALSNAIAVSAPPDTTAPTISAAVSAGTMGLNGWYTSNVTVHFTCSDSGSGIASCPADQVLSTESSSISSTAQTSTDNAGNNSASSNIVTVKIDKTAPTFSTKTAFSDWYTTDELSTFTYTDATSDIASGTPVNCTISTEGLSQTCSVTPNVCDNAGNCNTTLVTSNGVDIDKTKPATPVPHR